MQANTRKKLDKYIDQLANIAAIDAKLTASLRSFDKVTFIHRTFVDNGIYSYNYKVEASECMHAIRSASKLATHFPQIVHSQATISWMGGKRDVTLHIHIDVKPKKI